MAIIPLNAVDTASNKLKNEKVFTDREYQRDVFFDAIEHLVDNKQKYSVINYIGIGGIGKSALIKNIKEQLKIYETITFSYADFSNIRNQNLPALLFELSKNFENQQLSFYHFSIAYAIYFKKVNKDIKYNEEEHKILSNEMGLVGEILSLIEKYEAAAVIPDTINYIYSKLHKKLTINNEVKDSLKNLETLEPKAIEEQLPAFFAYDIKEYLTYNDEKNIVVFLDTYEAIYFNTTSEYSKYGKDSFIRELIAQLPGVLFVICSRKPLGWERVDEEWKRVITQQSIDVFSYSIADEFLLKCKIEEKDIRNKMIKTSMGLPYHLNILVDTYYEMKSQGITPRKELFASNNKKILACFFQYLGNDEIASIEVLSVARFYDFELFNYLMKEFATGYPITLFEQFNTSSYVSSSGNGIYHLHEIMRKDIIEELSPLLLNRIHQSLFNYYENLSCEICAAETKKEYIKEALYHAKYCMVRAQYSAFIMENYFEFFQALQNNGESKYLYDVLGDVFSYLECSESFELYEIYTDMIMLNGYFREAVVRIDEYLKNNSIEEIANSGTLLHLYVKKIKHQMVYSSLDSIIELVDGIKDLINKAKFPHQYCELLYTKGNMLLEKGEFKACSSLFNSLLMFSKEYSLTDMQCRIYRKITDCSLIVGDYGQAKAACSDGRRIASNYNYKRYNNYLLCSLAEIDRIDKKFEEAKDLYLACQKSFHELGINPWIAHTSLGIAEIALVLGDYQEVLSNLSIANAIYNTLGHEWGIIHTKLLELKYNYISKNIIDECKYNALIEKCRQMNYSVVEQELIELKSNQIYNENILFL